MSFNIEVTGESSFCPGVDRAFRITEKTLFGEKGRAFSLGPLIHNPEVVSRLAMLGLQTIEPDCRELPDLQGASVIIRSHGIDTATEEKLRRSGAVLVDATCPTVKRAQEAAAGLAEEGLAVLVLGSATHPEVRSIVGRTPGPVTVIESLEDALAWVEGEGRGLESAGIVCQTTISRGLLKSVVEALGERLPLLEVRDTICEAVLRRREKAIEVAKRVDLMVVVGGRNSSNTAQLAEICRQAGVSTRLIEVPSELEPGWFENVRSVGVTGGASTPSWLVDETVARLDKISAGAR